MGCCHMGGCFSRKETRLMEKRKQEEYTIKLERDLAQAMKELREMRVDVQPLTREIQNAMTRQEELEGQVADALQKLSLAETRAAIAETQYSDMEANIRASHDKHREEIHESSNSLQAAEELSRKLTMEVSCLERDLAQAIKELQEKRDDVQTLTLERQNAMTRQEEMEEQLADALRGRALAETRAAVAEMQYSDMDANIKASEDKIKELQLKLDELLNYCQCTFRSRCKTKKCTCHDRSRSCTSYCRCNLQHCMNTS